MRRKFSNQLDLLTCLAGKGLFPAVAVAFLASALGATPVYAQGQKTESKSPTATEPAEGSESAKAKDPTTTSPATSDR